MNFDEMDAFIAQHDDVVCPVCGKHDFTPIRKFNLMFKTAIGVTEDSSSTCYLRQERVCKANRSDYYAVAMQIHS